VRADIRAAEETLLADLAKEDRAGFLTALDQLDRRDDPVATGRRSRRMPNAEADRSHQK
jgi:hypothetical protein